MHPNPQPELVQCPHGVEIERLDAGGRAPQVCLECSVEISRAELQAYLQAKLRNGRAFDKPLNLEGIALSALRTADANLRYHQEKTSLHISIIDLQHHIRWIEGVYQERLPEVIKLMERAKVMLDSENATSQR